MEDYASDEDLFEEFPVKRRKKKEEKGFREPPGEKLLAEKLRALFVGVPPPPNLNDAVSDPTTFLELWYKNKDRYMWSRGPEVTSDGDIPEKKFGLYYNISEWSEEVDGLRRRYGERVVSLETDSWTQRSGDCAGAAALLTASAKKRARRNGWLRSPGRRLEYLARRRSVFAPPRPAPRRTILLDPAEDGRGGKPPPAPALRRSPRRGSLPVRALFTSPDAVGAPRRSFESPQRVGIRRRRGGEGAGDAVRRPPAPPPPRETERRRSSANRSLTFTATVAERELTERDRKRLLWAVARSLKEGGVSEGDARYREVLGRLFRLSARMWLSREEGDFATGGSRSEAMLEIAGAYLPSLVAPPPPSPPPQTSTPGGGGAARPVRVISSLVEDDGTPKATGRRPEESSPPPVSPAEPKTSSSESCSEEYRSPPVLEKMDQEGKRSLESDPGEVSPPVLEVQEPLSSGKKKRSPRQLERARRGSSAAPVDVPEAPSSSGKPQDLAGNSPVRDTPAGPPDSCPLLEHHVSPVGFDPTEVILVGKDTTKTPEVTIPEGLIALPVEITVTGTSKEGTPVPPVSPDTGSPLETTASVERFSDPECEEAPGIVTTTSRSESPSVAAEDPEGLPGGWKSEEQILNSSFDVPENAAVPGSPAEAGENPGVPSDIGELPDPGIFEVVPEEVTAGGSREGTESPGVLSEIHESGEPENLPEEDTTSAVIVESPEVTPETEDTRSGGSNDVPVETTAVTEATVDEPDTLESGEGIAESGEHEDVPEAVGTPGEAVSWEEESPLDSPDDAGARKEEEALPEAAHMSRAGETPPSCRVCDPDLPEEAREVKSPPETGKRRREEEDDEEAAAKRRRLDTGAAPRFVLASSAPRRDADVATVVFDLVRPVPHLRRFPDYDRRSSSDYRVLKLDEKTFELEIPSRVLGESVEDFVDVSAVLSKAGSLVEACAATLLASDEKENLSDNPRSSLRSGAEDTTSDAESSDSSSSGIVVAAPGRSLRVILPASAVHRYVDTAKIASVVTRILDGVGSDFSPRIGID